MILIDYVFMAIFALFIINAKTRVSALVLVLGYVAYWIIALEIVGLHRYGFIALINTSSGLYLTFVKRDTAMAVLFYSALIVCFIGGVLYVNYYPAYYYDNMCITIMALQVLALLYRVGLNGVNLRDIKLRTVYGYINDGRIQRLNQMFKSKSKKEANPCAKR